MSPATIQIQLPSLYDLTLEQLQKQLTEWNEPAFRAKQIFKWLYQRFVSSTDEMTDLSKPLRAKLNEFFVIHRVTPVIEQQSTDGWTKKWLLRLPDGSEIEAVVMEYDGVRRTACISSQAGCAMNCSFCATGQMGFLRNLRAGEIVEQVVWVARALANAESLEGSKLGGLSKPILNPLNATNVPTSARLSNLVLMGMGEPFANYSNVMEAVNRLMQAEDSGGFGLGARKITVSTVGLVPGIQKFTEADTQVNLAVSLHAATDALRDKLVPINIKYPIKELVGATRDYIKKTNRRVSYEWALIDGVNDSVEQAKALAEVTRDTYDPKKRMVHINMIPLNPTNGFRGIASQNERIAKFREVLDRADIPNTVRVRRGIDIAAGCGQLRERATKA